MALEPMWLLIALIAGMVLGFAYFGGLWFTLRRLPTTGSPILLVLSSFLVRTSAGLVGFYLVMDHQWERLLVTVAGFVVMRKILMQRWGTTHQALTDVKG